MCLTAFRKQNIASSGSGRSFRSTYKSVAANSRTRSKERQRMFVVYGKI